MNNGIVGMLSGGHIDFLNPQPEQFTEFDIAYGLCRESRYGGQVLDDAALMYSVCQHSVYGCWRALEITENDPVAGLVLLLHDASEAIGMKDLPSPLKAILPEYKAIETKVMAAVWRKFNINISDYEELMHRVDREVLNMELFTFREIGEGPGLDHFKGYTIWTTKQSFDFFNVMLAVLTRERELRDAA